MKMIIFLLLISVNVQAQKLFSKNNLISYGLMTISGAASGFTDALLTYKPFRGDKTFDPYVSWVNKWKNGDPKQGEKFFGSSTFLVWTTDGWHAVKLFGDLSACASVAISFSDLKDIKHKWKYILAKGLISYGFNRVGYITVYEGILR